MTTALKIWAGLVNSVSLATWANKIRHLNWFRHLGPFVHYGSVWPVLVGLAIKASLDIKAGIIPFTCFDHLWQFAYLRCLGCDK